jgi:uncharacterized protein (TIGR03435 family)
MRAPFLSGFVALLTAQLAAQTTTTIPEFELARIQVSPKRTIQTRSTTALATSYEVRNATMLDLISIGWGGYPPDRIVGGPNWLELDRFDVIGRMPPGATAEDRRLMLRPLLERRFKLVVHTDTRSLPGYALTAGKKIQIKEADGKGDIGCKPAGGPSAPGLMKFACRNVSMAAFAEALRTMGAGQYFEYQSVSDHTGLEGRWNFDISWSSRMMGLYQSDSPSFPEALEKQLGLKLERVPVPTPVLVVDSVNRRPTDNLPETEAAFRPRALCQRSSKSRM